MDERKTASMLQRMPVILAVTAASYGLQLPPGVAARMGQQGVSGATSTSQPMAASGAAKAGRRTPERLAVSA